jgi:8-oxo-dGTP pyrophosphatase MutT (NUDIX family)
MTRDPGLGRPGLLDRCYRVAFWVAFRLALAMWFVTRPAQEGHLAIIWYGGRALLIRNSYHALWSAPGGSAKAGETPAEAASRETLEEVGVTIPPAELRLVLDTEHRFRFRRDRIRIFGWDAPVAPAVAIDNREVIDAAWVTPAEALGLPLIPHLQDYFAALDHGSAQASALA